MKTVFSDARQMALRSLAELEPRHHQLAAKRRDFEAAFEKLNTYVNQKDELVDNARKIMSAQSYHIACDALLLRFLSFFLTCLLTYLLACLLACWYACFLLGCLLAFYLFLLLAYFLSFFL